MYFIQIFTTLKCTGYRKKAGFYVPARGTKHKKEWGPILSRFHGQLLNPKLREKKDREERESGQAEPTKMNGCHCLFRKQFPGVSFFFPKEKNYFLILLSRRGTRMNKWTQTMPVLGAVGKWNHAKWLTAGRVSCLALSDLVPLLDIGFELGLWASSSCRPGGASPASVRSTLIPARKACLIKTYNVQEEEWNKTVSTTSAAPA